MAGYIQLLSFEQTTQSSAFLSFTKKTHETQSKVKTTHISLSFEGPGVDLTGCAGSF